ncbi:right-handed parallel beta-helix repeat-containing protein [Vibrio nomapromontoriensis]|uniref:right-handed parallel beta-helix repeat-containing protein n=1 Tax=Vibrio nomapromontoriensis TaxID=2910246 RepID=UPI003D0F36D1
MNINYGILAIFMLTNALFVNASSAATMSSLYVAPDGNDITGSGTINAPWRSIDKAKNFIRTTALNDSMTGDIIVYLRGGDYIIDNTLSFSSNDSGSNGYTIKYKNYENEIPIVSGGVDFSSDWVLHDATNNIYKKTGVSLEFRQLYTNGEKAIRARTPNVGSWNNITSWDNISRKININSSDVSEGWGNIEQVEMVIRQEWAGTVMRVSSVNIEGSNAEVAFHREESDIIFNRQYPPKRNSQKYIFENAYELIDSESEWYLDTTADTLYYKPRIGENMETIKVVAPQVETLLAVNGTLDNPVHHISFSGLTFNHSTWMRPSNFGNLDTQAGQYNISVGPNNTQYVERQKAAVYVKHANNLRFERNIFEKLGAAAIDFHRGTHDNVFVGNIVRNISGTGVYVGVFSDENVEIHVPYNPGDVRDKSVNETISNNYITKIGQEYFGSIGIAAGYPESITIEHNELANLPYTGISVGWGWTQQSNSMRNNKVNNNYIHEFMRMLHDGGGIYTLSSQPNSVMNGNYLRNQTGEFGSLYFDEGTQHYSASNNVIENSPRWLHIWTSTISDIDVSNTYTTTSTQTNNGSNISISNTHYHPNANWPEEALAIIENAGLEPEYSDLNNDPDALTIVDGMNSSSVVFSGDWTTETPSTLDYSNTINWSSATIPGDYVEYTFTGTAIKWIGRKNRYSGVAKIYIDDILQGTVDTYSDSSLHQVSLFDKVGLSNAQHTIKIVSELAGSGGYYSIHVDAFEVN